MSRTQEIVERMRSVVAGKEVRGAKKRGNSPKRCAASEITGGPACTTWAT
jgi:hypothetical protein